MYTNKFTQIRCSGRRVLSSLFLLIVSTSLFAQPNVVFRDSLNSSPVGWRLRNATPHDWKWYNNQGTNGSGGLRMKLPNDSNYVVSPTIPLVAGKTYTLSFKSRMDQTASSRRVNVYISRSPFLSSVQQPILNTLLPANSYATPPFTEYTPVFTVPSNGNYYVIWDYQELGYLFTFLDDVIVEERVLPITSITSPITNSQFLEGTVLNLTANASDQDGTISKLEFFANGVKIGEDLTSPYSLEWKNILPGQYQLSTTATDNRGNVGTSSTISTTILFKDGTLGKYINWDFNDSRNNVFEYWTLKNGDFRTRTGLNGTPCFEIFSAFASCHAISPGFYLKAGQSYKLQVLGNTAGNRDPKFYINTNQTLGGTYIDTIKIRNNDNFAIQRNKIFTAPSTGTYYLVIEYPLVDNYIQLKMDNIRIIGDLEIPHTIKLDYPDIPQVIAQNSTVNLRSSVKKLTSQGIQKVQYYANANLVGESSTSPYNFIWQNVPSGMYQMSARVIDSMGVSALSTTESLDIRSNDFSASSFLGSSKADEIRSAVFLSDGTIVMAGNFGVLPQYAPIKLDNAVDSTMGSVVRLATDGRSVLSITRLCEKVTDMAIDSLDNIYVGGKQGTGGVYYKLNSRADNILYKKTFTNPVHRVDAGKRGTNGALTAPSTDFNAATLGSVKCNLYNSEGLAFGEYNGASQYTSDMAIDDASQTLILAGFRNYNTYDSPTGTQTLPVYVPAILGIDFQGNQKYMAYNWSSDRDSPRWLNKATNNMADVRTSKAVIGKDGKLYITYEVYGGNHILRYSPFDNMTTVPIVEGDGYFSFSYTGTETKAFVGRYEPSNFTYLKGQQFTARLARAPYPANSVFTRNGNIDTDIEGRVYLTGAAASGLPLTVDHEPGEYTGGAYVLVLSPDFTTREHCIRLTNGTSRGIAVQNKNRWICVGESQNPLYLSTPLQSSRNNLADGFFGIFEKGNCQPNFVLGKSSLSSRTEYLSNSHIRSQSKLSVGENSQYKAQSQILLQPGFEASTGSVFRASIQGCQ
ncbi:MAG: Ig-like domain-containing protein [Leadbetterella sp.]